MSDVFKQMAYDAGYRDEEAAQIARLIEEQEYNRWLSQKLHEQEVWEEEMRQLEEQERQSIGSNP